MLLSKKSILISGWYGGGNIGDEAILSSIIQGLRGGGLNCDIKVLTPFPDDVHRIYGLDAIKHVNLYSLKGFLCGIFKGHFWTLIKTAYDCDIILIGGGGLIKDFHGTRNLLHIIDEAYLFKILRKKCIFCFIGVEPLFNNLSKSLIRSLFRLVDSFIVRDLTSYRVIANIIKPSCKKKLGITSDPTFLLNPEPIRNCEEAWVQDVTESIIISPRALLEIATNKQGYSIPEVVAKVTKYLIEVLNVKVTFLPFCRNKGDNDLEIIKKILKMLPETMVSEFVIVIDDNYSPAQIKWIVSKAKGVIGMRLHSIIFASSVGVPFIGICGDNLRRPKIRDFAEEIEMSDFIYDIVSNDIEKLFALIDSMTTESVNIRKHLLDRAVSMKRRATECLSYVVEVICES